MTDIAPGLVGERQVVVTEDLTARHLGSGKVAVLATPAMIMLMEQAALAAVDPLLPAGQQTVGVRVEVRHLAATPQGMAVRVRAELREVDGRRLTFSVEAFDEKEKVGEGRHERMIISLDRFRQKLQAKMA
jgi:predicted thioesterase